MKLLTPKFYFESSKERDDFTDILESLRNSRKNSSPLSRNVSQAVFEIDKQSDDWELLTQEDWHLLLQGAKIHAFKKDETIVSEGQSFQRIYQITKGSCRIESKGRILGLMEAGQTFGEISFLLSGGATASVIADSESVNVYILEG